MKRVYDRKAQRRDFNAGDQVMVLLPVLHSLFQAKFAGPYEVVRKEINDNYVIATPDRKKKSQLCHANLLKLYHERKPEALESKPAIISATDSLSYLLVVAADREREGTSGGRETPASPPAVAAQVVEGVSPSAVGSPSVVAVLEEVDVSEPDDVVLLGRLKNSESLTNLPLLLSHLSPEQISELVALIKEFSTLFSDTPTQTPVITHDIDVGDASPVRQRFYRVSGERQTILEGEVQYLLEHGLAEPSFSSWASPCLLVNKADGSYRFCTAIGNSTRSPKQIPSQCREWMIA